MISSLNLCISKIIQMDIVSFKDLSSNLFLHGREGCFESNVSHFQPHLCLSNTNFHGGHIRQRNVSSCGSQRYFLGFKCKAGNDAFENSMTSEPKWKQKLAAADEHAERTRQLTLQALEECKRKQTTLRKQESVVEGEVTNLCNLEYIPFLDEEGLITNCSRADSKASVYAIFDQNKDLQYVGFSRQIYMSMRLHFTRVPSKCHFVKVQNITKPSRSLLELIKDEWIKENGSCPTGNDNGPQQNIWENPLDCKPLMTEEEVRKFEEASPGLPKAKVLKNVARRIECQLEVLFRERNSKEAIRFDPKLKEKGLLDLKNVQVKPDKSIPKTVPKPASLKASAS